MISKIKLILAACFGFLLVTVNVLLRRNKALNEEIENFEKVEEIREEQREAVSEIENKEHDKILQHSKAKLGGSRAKQLNGLLNNKTDT